jgi:hypothetical protein
VSVLSDAHSRYSSSREKVLEHLFISELLRTLWCMGVHDAEVLRSEVDGNGYDLAIECNSVLPHVRLKSSRREGKASRQNINAGIVKKPSGCVIWIMFDEPTLALGPFRWLGGIPGEPITALGDIIARHTKGNSAGYKAERPNIRVVNKSRFREVGTMTELARELFGTALEPCGPAASTMTRVPHQIAGPNG